MAFQYNHYYEIYNGGKYVNLNGDHENNVVTNGEKVTMYARTNNPDQRWALERYGSDNQVRIVLQRGGGWYALNYNTENTNCIELRCGQGYRYYAGTGCKFRWRISPETGAA